VGACPSHHRKLAPGVGVAHQGRIVRKHSRHRREVANIAVDHSKQINDRGCCCRDCTRFNPLRPSVQTIACTAQTRD
jgi:hypothetical protein